MRSPNWPPDYVKTLEWRQKQLKYYEALPEDRAQGVRDYYRDHPVEFIQDWCNLHEPRNATSKTKPTVFPFIMFKRQKEGVEFVYKLINERENGLEEKSRDVGVTWRCVCISCHLFLFFKGISIGWGSRKADLVDKIGDMDSIFEKIRWELKQIPRFFWPSDLDDDHMAYMKVWSDKTGASITGESGDDIGRGGRKTIYFKDESSHYARPEMIEAALMDNTDVQLDISSVNGMNNVFHRKREAGVEWEPGEKLVNGRTNVFITDWRDHPDKTQEWYDLRKKRAEDEGMLHVFYQEVDRNYAASVEGVVIPAVWVVSACDAHLKIPGMEFDYDGCALDVADEGGDTNATARRRGVVLKSLAEWGERDQGPTTRRAIDACKDAKRRILLQYDSVGVGAGVKTEYNRLREDGLVPRNVRLVPWNGGASVLDPDDHIIPDDRNSPVNSEFYMNLKAQGWWMLRKRFECTHRMLTEKGVKFKSEELISIDTSTINPGLLTRLKKELSQPVSRLSTTMKLLVDKAPKPKGSAKSTVKSPNLADAVMMVYWPCDEGDMSYQDWVK